MHFLPLLTAGAFLLYKVGKFSARHVDLSPKNWKIISINQHEFLPLTSSCVINPFHFLGTPNQIRTVFFCGLKRQLLPRGDPSVDFLMEEGCDTQHGWCAKPVTPPHFVEEFGDKPKKIGEPSCRRTL